MQNLFLLPTEKPSRLYKDGEKLKLDIESYGVNNQNIYITSDEEIKDGYWFFYIPPFKKIILTTDQDLISDGVQAIHDEFLEWFVKNPSFEFVEIERLEDGKYIDRFADGTIKEGVYENYKIIIPQEQPKPTPTENPPIKNGDVYDMGQTVNGVSRFLFLNEKWYYFEERLSREYEYDQDELTKLVNDTENDFNEVKYIGNIFSLNL